MTSRLHSKSNLNRANPNKEWFKLLWNWPITRKQKISYLILNLCKKFKLLFKTLLLIPILQMTQKFKKLSKSSQLLAHQIILTLKILWKMQDNKELKKWIRNHQQNLNLLLKKKLSQNQSHQNKLTQQKKLKMKATMNTKRKILRSPLNCIKKLLIWNLLSHFTSTIKQLLILNLESLLKPTMNLIKPINFLKRDLMIMLKKPKF